MKMIKRAASSASGASEVTFNPDALRLDAVMPALRASNKKQVLHDLARKAAEITGKTQEEILTTLIERERLGSTGIGRGIAIPHGKLPGLTQVYAIMARLEKSVNFDAIDEQPVDLLVLLLAPAEAGADHLKALAKVSRLLRNTEVCEKLRGCTTADAIYAVVQSVGSEKSAA